jgi:hypothetical protein
VQVAIFGCGDAQAYGDYFCDAMEELATSFSAAGADLVGAWPADGYGHSDSKVGIGQSGAYKTVLDVSLHMCHLLLCSVLVCNGKGWTCCQSPSHGAQT